MLTRKGRFTFSETILLFPLRSSGAIHGKVPLTPPDTKVCCLTFDSPRSPIWSESIELGKSQETISTMATWVPQKDKIARGKVGDQTLQIGRCGSLMFTSRFSHFRSKWTIFFPCKYSMPNAASMANITRFRRSIVLHNLVYFRVWYRRNKWTNYSCIKHQYLSFFLRNCLRDPLTINSVTVAKLPSGPSRTTP